MLRKIFNSAVFHAPRLPLNLLFKACTRPMLGMDQPARDTRAETALAFAALLENRFPDLAVSWAARTLFFTRPGSEPHGIAVHTMLDNMPAAFGIDRYAVNDAVQVAAVGRDTMAAAVITSKYYELAPEEAPGPWGERPRTEEQFMRDWHARAPLRMRLSYYKHQLLRRPKADDVTIPGSFGDGPEP